MEQEIPEGFVYISDFITVEQEQLLLSEIGRLEFSTVVMHGITARRRVVHFGLLYGYESYALTPGPPIPDFLLPLRARAATLIETDPHEFAEVLVTQYPPGAVIGWHRDAPAFGRVVGVSLAASCRMRFRKAVGNGWETAAIQLEPRSGYVLRGPARAVWQHSIPAVKSLRYSVTFRTLRKEQRKRKEPQT